MQAARYLGVAPWELEDVPVAWQIRAHEARRTEAELQEG